MSTEEQPDSGGIPLTDLERRIWADIKWAENDEHVQTGYAVAIFERTIVAHGTDRGRVEEEAIVASQQPLEAIAIWPIPTPFDFLTD